VAFNLGYYYKALECLSSADRFCAVTFEGSFFMDATLGLCLATLGLWFRRTASFLLSSIALIWVVIVYILWYRGTLSVMGVAEVQKFSQLPNQPQYLFPLIEATWWDIVVLCVTLLVLLWQAVILVRIPKSIGSNPENQRTSELG
jgi:hypothetical protein